MKEFTGFYDNKHNKLYVGDKVVADNGSIGIINKHQDTWSSDETKDAYHVDWKGIHENLGGITNEHIRKQK